MSFDVRKRLSQLRSSAKARGLNVNLDINKYQALVNSGCHFCGSSLENENGYCLDRIDSSKGYNLMNVVPCCKICNRAKSNMEIWDFVDWLKKANDHTQKVITMVQDEIYSQEEELAAFMEIKPEQSLGRIKVINNT